MTKMQVNEWLNRQLLGTFEHEGTNAHRLCTIDNGWAERFERDVVISFRTERARDRLLLELQSWASAVEFQLGRVFGRFLPRKNEDRETPKLLSGNESESLETIATENHLKFGIDFAAGYSVGLFVDQRENRSFVTQMNPKGLLNCFAYTYAFSVSVAALVANRLN